MLYDSNEAVGTDGSVNLYFDSILSCTPEFLDLEVLLEPLEEQFYLSTILVKVSVHVLPLTDELKFGNVLDDGLGEGSLIRPEIRKETTKQNHKRVMRSGSWIQATGPNNGHQLRDYSKSSNRSEIATPHKTTTMQEKQKILDLLHIFLHRFRVASGR